MLEFAAITANGATAAQKFTGPTEGATIPATIRMAGTWDGATATLQVRPPDLTAEGDWISLTADTASSSDAVGVIELCAGWSVRVLVSGATATTNLNVRVN